MVKLISSTEFIGKKYNRLTILYILPKGESQFKQKGRVANVICDCGDKSLKLLSYVVGGHIKSCGCLQKEKAYETVIKRNTSHGLSRTRLYNIYLKMIARCAGKVPENVKKSYSDIGVVVCDEWKKDFITFYNWSMQNGYDKNLSLDRYPKRQGNYEPENCRWATMLQQSQNRDIVTRYMYNGKEMMLPELAILAGINYPALHQRVHKLKWPIKKAVETPLMFKVV